MTFSRQEVRSVSRRSRFGCRNCKLRKTKCDEAKPQCTQCTAFRVVCNYRFHVPDLHPVADDSATISSRHESRAIKSVRTPVWSSDGTSTCHLDSKCQVLITRYLEQNLTTPNDINMAQVNKKLLQMSFKRPYLMHASLAVALAHDRYLNGPANRNALTAEHHHWSRGIALLKRRLDQPLHDGDRDAIWGTAAALSVLTFACPDANSPELSWPLKTGAPCDFGWLRIHKGKMSLWNDCNPIRPRSIFRILADTYTLMSVILPESGMEGIPADLAHACALSDISTPLGNPYFTAAHTLSRFLKLPDNAVSIGHVEPFMRCIDGVFEALLREKDPVALVMIFLWYQKARRNVWWIDLRARVEARAIEHYLRSQQNHPAVIRLLTDRS